MNPEFNFMIHFFVKHFFIFTFDNMETVVWESRKVGNDLLFAKTEQ